MDIDLIAGARPNFMKISPIIDQIKLAQSQGENINFRLLHTGQHYDSNMSDNFFDQLNIPLPHINLNAGGGSQTEQIAKIMVRYEEILNESKPDYCLVVGDVNSTVACSITAKNNEVKVIHVEGGIRSWDKSMPEEKNRILTDSITDYFFTTSRFANENLSKSGIKEEQIFFVGNTMIDTLIKHRKNFSKPLIWDRLGLKKNDYFVVTLHRPSNVDKKRDLKLIIKELVLNSNQLPIIFPAHPRTFKQFKSINYKAANLFIVDPMSYLEFNFLVENSKAVITDSGGITEETTFLNIPCITIRDSTERPETVQIGTNLLIGTDPKSIGPAFQKLLKIIGK